MIAVAEGEADGAEEADEGAAAAGAVVEAEAVAGTAIKSARRRRKLPLPQMHKQVTSGSVPSSPMVARIQAYGAKLCLSFRVRKKPRLTARQPRSMDSLERGENKCDPKRTSLVLLSICCTPVCTSFQHLYSYQHAPYSCHFVFTIICRAAVPLAF